MVNGEPRDEHNFRGISAYVLQDDNLYAHLTVVETLTLAATFFLPSTATEEFKSQLVEACIAELGLVKARDTRIGNEKVRGVSGGERKRVAIAQQLISDPAVLFLDEPTSGLDSFQALSVMESMKDLAMNGRLVISVIHQPRSSIFSMFDQLLLLSEGRTMYSGPAENAVAYFADVGFPCAAFYNPSDFFLDLLSPDNRSPELEEASQARIQRLGDVWLERGAGGLAQSKNGASTDNLANLVSEPQSAVRAVGTSGDCKKALTNLRVLCWRAFAAQSRDIGTFIFKCVLTTFFALIIGGIYSNIGFSQLSIQNRNGILYFICINIAFNNLIGVLNTFPTEKIIVNRERASRAYDTFSYFFAKVIIEIPLNTFPAVLYSCIVYWLVGLRPAGFGYFILIVMFEAIVAISLGLGISALAPSVEAANAFGPILMVIGILFGGFYLNVGSLPIVANWIPYFSIFYWTFQALAVNEYTGLTFTCDDAKGGSCLATGEMVIASLSFNSNAMNLAQINYACFGQGMLLIGFLGVAYILLSLSQVGQHKTDARRSRLLVYFSFHDVCCRWASSPLLVNRRNSSRWGSKGVGTRRGLPTRPTSRRKQSRSCPRTRRRRTSRTTRSRR
jgi:ABC-type multidrug transport system ATPase subunit